MKDDKTVSEMSCDPHGDDYDWFEKLDEYAGKPMDFEQSVWNTNLLYRGMSSAELHERLTSLPNVDFDLAERLKGLQCDFAEGYLTVWQWRIGMFENLRRFLQGDDARWDTVLMQRWDGYMSLFWGLTRQAARGSLPDSFQETLHGMNAELMNAELDRWIRSVGGHAPGQLDALSIRDELLQKRLIAERRYRNGELTNIQWIDEMFEVCKERYRLD